MFRPFWNHFIFITKNCIFGWKIKLRSFLIRFKLIQNKLSGVFVCNNFEITSSVFWISSQSLRVSVPLYFDCHGFINLVSNLWGPRCVKIYQKNETWLSSTTLSRAVTTQCGQTTRGNPQTTESFEFNPLQYILRYIERIRSWFWLYLTF